MSAHRKNTLVVDFSTLPKRPVLDQVEEFLKKNINLDMADVKSIQLHHLENCVFIEMNNASIAPRLHKQHHLRHSFVYEGVDYFVPVYVDGPTTAFKIHGLPPQMPNSLIINNLQQYGKVLSIQNEVWINYFPGVPNGVRVVRMRMEKPLPAYITVDNHRSYVSYPKHQRTSSDASEKTAQPQATAPPSTERNDKQCAPPSGHSDSSDDSDGDDDGNNSNEQSNQCDTTLESTGKRRLSTETVNSQPMEENEPKRSCSQNSKPAEKGNTTEWKVYQTRSKRRNESGVK